MAYLVFCSREIGGWPFAIADILNRHGVETRYVSVQTGPADPHDTTAYHHGARRMPWDDSERFRPFAGRPRRMVAELRSFCRMHGVRAAFATGQSARLLHRAGVPYLYWVYGADLDQMCFLPGLRLYRPLAEAIRTGLDLRRKREAHRRSIRAAASIFIYPHQYDRLARVRPEPPLYFLPHPLPPAPAGECRRCKDLHAPRLRAELGCARIVFSSARHFWAGERATWDDAKGNDTGLRMFAGALERLPEPLRSARLLLVRKGPDVEASARLCRELKIADRVTWLDEMPRAALDAYYAGADVCLGQFATPVLSCAALEPLRWATPCVSRMPRPTPRLPLYPEMPPLVDTADPEEGARRLAHLLSDDDARARAGQESREWMARFCTEDAFVAALLDAWRSILPEERT